MSNQRVWPGLVAVVLSVSLIACSQDADRQQRVVDTGRRLVDAGGCQACHTPKVFTEGRTELDSSRTLSGHPADAGLPEFNPDEIRAGALFFNKGETCWVGSWGASFARNLTPDDETGIGRWSEQTFIQAARTGRHLGRSGQSPMPWVNLARMSEDDLRAIFAYLKTLPAIHNEVPAHIPLEQLTRR